MRLFIGAILSLILIGCSDDGRKCRFDEEQSFLSCTCSDDELDGQTGRDCNETTYGGVCCEDSRSCQCRGPGVCSESTSLGICICAVAETFENVIQQPCLAPENGSCCLEPDNPTGPRCTCSRMQSCPQGTVAVTECATQSVAVCPSGQSRTPQCGP